MGVLVEAGAKEAPGAPPSPRQEEVKHSPRRHAPKSSCYLGDARSHSRSTGVETTDLVSTSTFSSPTPPPGRGRSPWGQSGGGERVLREPQCTAAPSAGPGSWGLRGLAHSGGCYNSHITGLEPHPPGGLCLHGLQLSGRLPSRAAGASHHSALHLSSTSELGPTAQLPEHSSPALPTPHHQPEEPPLQHRPGQAIRTKWKG